MVISVLVIAFVYSSISISEIYAVPPDKNWGTEPCIFSKVSALVTCCWFEGTTRYCQDCVSLPGESRPNCNPKETLFLEQPPTPPPSGPAAPLQDGGVLQQPPVTRGQGVLPEDGALQQQQQQPADEEAARTVEPPTEDETTQPTQEPLPCPEGQVLDEETGLCVLEEPAQPEAVEPEIDEELPVDEDSGNN